MNAISRAVIRIQVLQNHLTFRQILASASLTDDVIIKTVGDKGVITLNRPKALNALNMSMITKILSQLKKWNDESSVKFIIIKGISGRAFCAGGDARVLAEAKTTSEKNAQKDYIRERCTLNNAIGTLRVPWIALIDGITMGGGASLLLHGHYRVATERTVFSLPEASIGLHADCGYFLSRLPGKLGIYLALTGVQLKTRDVHRAGLATHFVESEKITDLENELLALRSATVKEVDKILNLFHNQCSIDKDKPFVLAEYLCKINQLFSGATLEEIFENLKRDQSDWAMTQLEILKKKSPTAMKVSLCQLQMGVHLSRQENLQMEYRLSQRIVPSKDFLEGVRSIFIDKDLNPCWNPATIEGVSDEAVNAHFLPLPPDEELKL